MSNNLVSQPMPGMQMSQLESIMNKVDSSGREMQMGLLCSGSGDPMLQQLATSNDHVGSLRTMPGNSGSQGLPMSTMQSRRIEAHISNPGMHQLFVPNKQYMQMGTISNDMGSQQLSTTPKRKAPMELSASGSVTSSKQVAQMEHRPWLQQESNTSSKASPKMQSLSNSSRPQRLLASGKKKTQMESTSSISGAPRSLNSRSQNVQMKQSSKVQTESSESVRSKMRESLAAALALVSQQDKPPVPNNSRPNDASTSHGKMDNISQFSGSAPASTDTALEQRLEISQSVDSSFVAADSVDHVMGEHRESTTSNEDYSENCKNYEVGATNASNNETTLNSMEVSDCDRQEFQSSYTFTTDDVPFSDGFFMKDELLQGNGLSWVISDIVDLENQRESQTNSEQRSDPEEIDGGCREADHSPEHLASRIEAELFKLFGGVNKKYKEKGRSLLFNLKDRNNPELRERVMSGEIPPEQLCSMSAEELASKELSQWRIAKAEELAQMVVLPDSDVDIRRLVKKTHKGEFQVEVEHEDNVSVEVSGGGPSVTRSETTRKDVEAPSSKPDVNKGDMNADGEKSNLQKDNPFSITISSNDGTDPMQGLMADEALKDSDFLPPIVSLDEFMESLHSEPPFENLPVESGDVDKDDSEAGSQSKSTDLIRSEKVDVTPDNTEKVQNTCASTDVEEEKKFSAESGVISSDTRGRDGQANMKLTDGHTKERPNYSMKSASNEAELTASIYAKTAIPTNIWKGECIWEGMLQLNISSTHSVRSIFKSGEKTSAKDWPGFLEIKGRVRLEAFEKFLQDLRLSRSRAIMVLHFVSKGSSPTIVQSTLSEVADSYISDERVGFAEPVPGVELYFCPPHKKTVEMLSKILPKERTEAINSIDNGLIGVIVWRKTNLTSSVSPTALSHHKHSSKKQYFTRTRQDSNVNVNPIHKSVPSKGIKTTETGPHCDDGDDDDDVPPGFGLPVTRIEDDLPEFNFFGGSNPSHMVQKPMGPGVAPLNQTPSRPRPVEQMRELVHKYGQNKANESSVNWQGKFGVKVQPWNDDDDDIPEWQPQNQFHTQQQSKQNFHLRPHLQNQSFVASPGQSMVSTQYVQAPMNVAHGQRNIGTQWLPSTQGNNVQPYGASVHGTIWGQNVSRSRGF